MQDQSNSLITFGTQLKTALCSNKADSFKKMLHWFNKTQLRLVGGLHPVHLVDLHHWGDLTGLVEYR